MCLHFAHSYFVFGENGFSTGIGFVVFGRMQCEGCSVTFIVSKALKLCRVENAEKQFKADLRYCAHNEFETINQDNVHEIHAVIKHSLSSQRSAARKPGHYRLL